MISTYTIKQPLTFQKKSSNLWLAAPIVLSFLGHLFFGWKEPQLIGVVSVGWGITSVLFLMGWKSKKKKVKTLPHYDLHFWPETIVVGPRTYPVSDLRNLQLNVGHYDGESVVEKKGVLVALKGLQLFADGPNNNPEFYDGSDSQLSFFAGGTKISLSFYVGSEAQRAQFNTLFKMWYAAGIPVQEFSNGLRTYLGKQLRYAQIQEFKAQFGLKEQQHLKGGLSKATTGAPTRLPAG